MLIIKLKQKIYKLVTMVIVLKNIFYNNKMMTLIKVKLKK